MREVDVAIVGFGPVGAVAACLLGQAGLRTHVIDSAHDIYPKPRAVALDHEIARVLQGLGLGEALAAHAEPFTDSVYFGADGRVIKRLTMLPEPYPQGWTPSMVFMQPALEAAIRENSLDHASLSADLGRTLVDLRQDADGVSLDVAGPGVPETIRARYVVGCDGAASTTRKLAGLALADLDFDEPWLVVDVIANAEGLARLPRTSVQYCEPTRPTTHVICTGAHCRWEFRLSEGEDPRAMEKPEAVWRLLSRWIGPEHGELWRSASYRFHALVAERWRAGRVFIAGDAAHQQPPFLGQGLCQGIRDVANLSWKLAARLRGEAGEALLDTYGAERGGHVRALTATIKGIGRLIGERDPSVAAARDDRLIAEAGGKVRAHPRQDLMPSLAEGFITAAPHSGRGTLFPQPWLETPEGRRRMDDVLGRGMRLIADRTVPPGLAAAARASGCAILALGGDAPSAHRECDGVAAGWLRRHDAAFALVRPDNYVFGVAADEAGALELLLEAGALLRA
jgi:3-(3-hydroxy-phenyl)propionate hydroxylase